MRAKYGSGLRLFCPCGQNTAPLLGYCGGCRNTPSPARLSAKPMRRALPFSLLIPPGDMTFDSIFAAISSCFVALCFPFAAFAADIPAQESPLGAPASENAQSNILPPPQSPGDMQCSSSDGGHNSGCGDSLLAAALSAPPPRRASYAPLLSSPEKLAHIDEWIQNTTADHPQNLILKDILASMPPRVGGPRIAALAKKSRDPAAQDSYARWLAQYPDAYAAVVLQWLKQNDGNPAQMLRYLDAYAELAPGKAIEIWAQLRLRYPISELGGIADFGLGSPFCIPSLRAVMQNASDEISKLRAARALIRCDAPETGETSAAAQSDPAEQSALKSAADAFYASKLPSRRIVALDLYARFFKNDAQVLGKIKNNYGDIKNSTEKSFALRALSSLDPDSEAQKARVIDALQNGDETLRLAASELIAQTPEMFDSAVLQDAFKKEIWPETQDFLYAAVSAGIADPDARIELAMSALRDSSRSASLRLQALSDIARTAPQKINFELMAQIQNESDPQIDVIAAVAETLYRSRPQTRPDLRAWLRLQAPFSRRLAATFSRFVRIDASSEDRGASAAETMIAICGATPVQDAVIGPCLGYFESRTDPTAEEKSIVQRLKNRQNQIDRMLGFEL